MHDLITEEDIKKMVDEFYARVNKDPLLSPVFNDYAGVDWDSHLPKMYKFWNSIVLGIPGYKGQPFPVHAKLPVHNEHFARWVRLFKENIDMNFEGPNAEQAKGRAEYIATIFQYKMGLIHPDKTN